MGVASIKDSDIEKAAEMDDVDGAAKHLQDIAGITTGDVAGQCLDEKRWRTDKSREDPAMTQPDESLCSIF